jgi:glutathione S-transferase
MAAKTLAAGVKPPHLIYMSAWFCPFAHRATLALQHHKTHLTYEWIEALGWEKRVASDECVQTAHENWYHFKGDPGAVWVVGCWVYWVYWVYWAGFGFRV